MQASTLWAFSPWLVRPWSPPYHFPSKEIASNTYCSHFLFLNCNNFETEKMCIFFLGFHCIRRNLLRDIIVTEAGYLLVDPSPIEFINPSDMLSDIKFNKLPDEHGNGSDSRFNHSVSIIYNCYCIQQISKGSLLIPPLACNWSIA